MATKVNRRATSSSAPTSGRTAAQSSAQTTAVETLNILHPERELFVGDRLLEFREYGYVEGLKLQVAARPFLDALFELYSQASAPPSAEAIADVMAEHILVVNWMQAQSITPLDDQDPNAFVAAVTANAKWLHGLGEDAGDLVTAMWWEVNKHFFTRRLQRRSLALSEAVRRASQSASSASTTP